MFKRARLIIFVVLVLVCAVARAQQQDPFVGTWVQNLAKSQYDPAIRTFKTFSINFEPSEKNIWKVTQDWVVNSNGKQYHNEYTVPLDGTDSPLKGLTDWDTVSVKRLNANTLITVNKKDGTVGRMILTVVSADGKTLTEDVVGYEIHLVPFHNVIVFEKQ